MVDDHNIKKETAGKAEGTELLSVLTTLGTAVLPSLHSGVVVHS